MTHKISPIVFGILMFCGSCSASIITLVTSAPGMGSNDSVTWGQLGVDNTAVTGPLTTTSVKGATVGVSIADTTGTVFVNGGPELSPAIGSPFGGTDTVLAFFDENTNDGTGPATFSTSALYGMGAAIAPDSAGAFTAEIQLYSASTLLATFTEASNANGDPIFIGALDTLPEITSAVFSLTSGTNNNNETNFLGDFSVDTLLLTEPAAAAPEPGTLLLFGGGLLTISLARRRKNSH